MKGKLIKSEIGWIVATTDMMEGGYSCANTFQLHPDDIARVDSDSDDLNMTDVEFELKEINLKSYAKIKWGEKSYTEKEVKALINKAYNAITRRKGLSYAPSYVELQKEVDKLINQ